MIGRRIGHYEVVERLGAGGMGVVYRARDTRLDRMVALKALPDELASQPDALRRFEREAKALASLNHPNIVTLHSIEEQDGSRFLAMELIEGRTLADSIPAHGMPLADLFAVAIPLADALAAAHERGIVHRDLKPANVMLTSEGRVKVLDFGLVKLQPRETPSPTAATRSLPLTQEGSLLGTAPYMSPEQVRGGEADARSDLFALGCVLHEMATGRRPFAGDSSVELFHSILTGDPPPVDAARPELPHHLARIVGRCLEKDPRRRYQSALEVRNELENLARELSSPTERPGRTGVDPASGSPRPAAPGRRRRTYAAASVALVALALGWWIVRGGRRSPPAGAEGAVRSLAVLPFANLTHDEEQTYFVDGMQDTLITELSKISALKVISRTSTMRYRDARRPLPEIARELGVDALIEGSVLRAGGHVRITAQLIRGANDQHLWAESYDRELGDILPLMSDVAGRIAEAIELALTPTDREQLSPRHAVRPEVLEVYLRGRHAFNEFSADGFRRARELGRRTIALDPEWAEGRVLVASADILLNGLVGEPAEETVPEARREAERALELDPNLSAAHTALGWVRLYADWDWEGGAAAFRAALRLNPNDAYARHGLGDYLCAMGRVDEALEQVELGRQADPFNRLTVLPLVGHLLIARRYERAAREGREAEKMLGMIRALQNEIALALWFAGRREEAVSLWLQQISRIDDQVADDLEQVEEEQGEDAFLRRVAEAYSQWADSGRAGALTAASWLALAGENERSLDWLEKAYDERQATLFLVKVYPQYDGLRAEPRYRDLLARLGLEP